MGEHVVYNHENLEKSIYKVKEIVTWWSILLVTRTDEYGKWWVSELLSSELMCVYICYSKTVKPGIWPNPWSVQQFGQIPVSLRDLAKSLKCLGIWPNYWNKEGHICQFYWTHFRDIVKWQWASFYDKLNN